MNIYIDFLKKVLDSLGGKYGNCCPKGFQV